MLLCVAACAFALIGCVSARPAAAAPEPSTFKLDRWTWSDTYFGGQAFMPEYGFSVALDPIPPAIPSKASAGGRSLVAGPEPRAIHVSVSNPDTRIGLIIASDPNVVDDLAVVLYYRVPDSLRRSRDVAGIPPVATSRFVTRPYLVGTQPGTAVAPGGSVELNRRSAPASAIVVPTRDRAAWEALFRRKPDFVTVSIASGTWFGRGDNGIDGGTIGTWNGTGKRIANTSLPRATPDANGGPSDIAPSTPASTPSRRDGATAPAPALTPSSSAPQVSVDGGDTCAVRHTGQVLCWGLNNAGQLGNGTSFDHARPGFVRDLADARAISIGREGTVCALRRGGSVSCWGDPTAGSIGNGKIDYENVPTRVLDLDDAVSVAAGAARVCAIRRARSVVCWGDTTMLTHGAVFDVEATRPVQMKELTGVRALAMGSTTSCALLATSRVACWGEEQYGEFGDGKHRRAKTPQLVPGIAHVRAIAADGDHYCALVAAGTVTCWGDPDKTNTYPGAIWHGPRHPWTIGGIHDAIAITASCAIRKSHTVVCWGDNAYGQIGNGTTKSSLFRALPVPRLDHITSISSGEGTACATRRAAAATSLYCWGANAGTGKVDYLGHTAPTLRPALITPL